MDLTNIAVIKNILGKYGLQPNKRLGQNFLISQKALRKIIESAELKKDDVILEIGPGIGTLTQELAKKVKKVFAIEKDSGMREILEETLKNFKNVEVIIGDALETENTQYKILNTNYKIVANLPYYITSPVIKKFLETENPPELMVLMVQKEVGQRICAKPPNMSLLAVSVQFYAKPEIIGYAPKTAFWPSPKVDSAIIKIFDIKNQKSKVHIKNQKLFFLIAKAGFAHPRKQIIGNLSGKLNLERKTVEKWLQKSNIKPEQRAETLEIRDWLNLAESYPQK